MMRIAIALIILSSIGACTNQSSKVARKDQTIDVKESILQIVDKQKFEELMTKESVQIIDVRRPYEFKDGHIRGAINLDFFSETFKKDLEKLDKNNITLVYCAAGGRSGKTSDIMKDMGFVEIYDLKGGYYEWMVEERKKLF